MKSQILGLMCVAVLLLTAITSATVAQDSMKRTMVSSADQKFMMMAGSGGMAEIEMAQIALQKSSNDAVKQYAQKMIDDHTMAGDELKQIASMKNVTLSMQSNARSMAKMQNASGMEFDMMYLKEAVKGHQDMEKLFMKESMSGKDMETKAFAAKTLPVVRTHLQMAREVMMNMKGMKSRMSGMKTN
ncbi:MAG TPA: DUF4142 domain-containing protein [Pyrinomonadaceae bacterium]